MIDRTAVATEINERGYCVLEACYHEEECRQIRAIMDRLCEQKGGLSPNTSYIGLVPFLQLAPEMAPFFGRPDLVETFAEVLQDAPRLAHSGASVTNEYANPFIISWHTHYQWEVPPDGLNRQQPERIFCNVYVDGSTPEIGQLILIPRRLNDPIDQPCSDRRADWPGQVNVVAPPGSAVIFDSALWHTGKRGTKPGLRHLFGGEYQRWHDLRPHPEDNISESPALAQYKRDLPALRRLIDGP
ncbi:MAG: hypothetical protein HY710_16665 [Candidatus Latescibacteria bacterium]|nr:hypothetical protein [Candidatus Latescibacterota bacterium]